MLLPARKSTEEWQHRERRGNKRSSPKRGPTEPWASLEEPFPQVNGIPKEERKGLPPLWMHQQLFELGPPCTEQK